MRDGQVIVPLPLNLNTEEAWVGQGRRHPASGSRSGVTTVVRCSHAVQGPIVRDKWVGRERSPVSDGLQSKETSARYEDSRVARGW